MSWEFPEWMRSLGARLGPDLSGYVEEAGYEHPDAAEGARGLVPWYYVDFNANLNTDWVQVIPRGYYNCIRICTTNTTGAFAPFSHFMRFGRLTDKQMTGQHGGVGPFFEANPPQHMDNLSDTSDRIKLLKLDTPLQNSPFFVWFRDPATAAPTAGKVAVTLTLVGSRSL